VLGEDPEDDFEENKFEQQKNINKEKQKHINKPTAHEGLVHLSKDSSKSSQGPVVKLIEDDNKGHKLEYLNVVLNPEEGNFHLFKNLTYFIETDKYSDVMEDVQLDGVSERSFLIEDKDQMKEKTFDENQGTHHTFNKPKPGQEDKPYHPVEDKEKGLPHSVQTERIMFKQYQEPKRSGKYFGDENVRSTPMQKYDFYSKHSFNAKDLKVSTFKAESFCRRRIRPKHLNIPRSQRTSAN
jgi:hypothetical protein